MCSATYKKQAPSSARPQGRRHRVGKAWNDSLGRKRSLLSRGKAKGRVFQAKDIAWLLKTSILSQLILALGSLICLAVPKFTFLIFVTIACHVQEEWERERAWRVTKRKEDGNKIERGRKRGKRKPAFIEWLLCARWFYMISFHVMDAIF